MRARQRLPGVLLLECTAIAGLFTGCPGCNIIPSFDSAPPTVPANLVVTGTTASTVSLSWSPSKDGSGVVGYRVFRDGSQTGSTTRTNFTDVALTPLTPYKYVVSAYDAAGNASATSSPAAMATTAAAPPSRPLVFPLRASDNKRYLVDQGGTPVLMVGDAPHGLFTSLSEAEAKQYFEDRAAHGVNCLWVEILVNSALGGSADAATHDGIIPFTTPNDFSTPNPKYFERIDDMVRLAARYGMTMFMDTLENDGWMSIVEQNGTAKIYNFGAYLGNRYKNFPNIIWMVGNDFQTWKSNPADNALALAIIQGILSADKRHLLTTELDYNMSGSLDDSLLAPFVSLAGAYTYFPPYYEVQAQYNNPAKVPVFLEESYYEGDVFGNLKPTTATTLMLRKIAYEAILSGGTAGYMYGSKFWKFQPGWQSGIDSPGAADLARWATFFNSISFFNLVPDQSHSFVVSGYGNASGNNSGNIQTDMYVTAANTADGTLGVVYFPATDTSVTVDLGKFTGVVTAEWFDPTGSNRVPVTGSPFKNAGTRSFSSPGLNSSSEPDWVLLLHTQ